MRKYDNNRIVTFKEDHGRYKKDDKAAMNVKLIEKIKRNGAKVSVDQINVKEIQAKRQEENKK